MHCLPVIKVKVAHTRLPSVGFRCWSRFMAVSLQVTWVIYPAAGYHYFLPGLQLPSQPLRYCLVNRDMMGVNSLPKTVTRQNHGCDLNPGHSVPESSTLTTRLPSHPLSKYHNAMRADTVGEVAAARSGSRPPHDAIRLSASWDMTWVTFTANTWFSDAFTKSMTVFVVCLQ